MKVKYFSTHIIELKVSLLDLILGCWIFCVECIFKVSMNRKVQYKKWKNNKEQQSHSKDFR